jgi:hypothetical protein
MVHLSVGKWRPMDLSSITLRMTSTSNQKFGGIYLLINSALHQQKPRKVYVVSEWTLLW